MVCACSGWLLAGMATPAPLLHCRPSSKIVASLNANATSDDGDQRRLAENFDARRAAEHARFVTDEAELLAIGSVWALLFNSGSGNEGIYSRRMGAADLVLTFEDRDDAERYATMLCATDFPAASSVRVDVHTLLDFVRDGGHTLGMVRQGDLVLPPEHAVPEFEWSPGSSVEGTQGPIDMTSDELDASRRALDALFHKGDSDDAAGPL